MSEIEIQKEFSGYLVLTKDGLSSGNVNFNEHLPKMLFESVFLKDATLFSLLSLAKEHKDFFENLISNNIVDSIFNYMEHIDWGKNSHLFYKKFGKKFNENYKDKHIVLRYEKFFDEKMGVSYLKNDLSVFLVDDSGENRSSLFAERLENLLDLPVRYEGMINKEGGNVFIPLLLGNLFFVLLSLILSLCEGSPIVEDKMMYLD